MFFLNFELNVYVSFMNRNNCSIFKLQPSIFDGLGEEMSVSSASLLKPRKRLVLKNKDKENTPPASALFIGEEQPQTNGQIVEMNNKLAPTIKASKQLEFSFNSEKDTGMFTI